MTKNFFICSCTTLVYCIVFNVRVLYFSKASAKLKQIFQTTKLFVIFFIFIFKNSFVTQSASAVHLLFKSDCKGRHFLPFHQIFSHLFLPYFHPKYTFYPIAQQLNLLKILCYKTYFYSTLSYSTFPFYIYTLLYRVIIFLYSNSRPYIF